MFHCDCHASGDRYCSQQKNTTGSLNTKFHSGRKTIKHNPAKMFKSIYIFSPGLSKENIYLQAFYLPQLVPTVDWVQTLQCTLQAAAILFGFIWI